MRAALASVASLAYADVATPAGRVRLVASPKGLREVLVGGPAKAPAGSREDASTMRPYVRALERYFAGDRRAFDGLPRDVAVGTPFQRKVWAALETIPWGETRSYAWLAAAVGSPKAFRAVGQANHHNPLGIVVPCHRVVAADGTLGGYAGGLAMKEKLLAHERRA